MIDQLTRADFEQPGGPMWIAAPDGSRLPVTVAETRNLTPTHQRAHPFSVILEGPAAPLLAQGIHGFLHPRLGHLELFMVPIGRNGNLLRYELIFN